MLEIKIYGGINKMITFEEAQEIAFKYKSDVDQCEEYEDAFIFSNKECEAGTSYGFSHIVVLKENGNAISMSSYNMRKPKAPFIKNIEF